MPDYSLPAHCTLVVGKSGEGKTTFCYRFLANAVTVQAANPDPAACVFIYDWKNEAAARFGLNAVTTEHGIESALASRFVIFNPHLMFPGDQEVRWQGEKVLNDHQQGCLWFCQKVCEISQRGPGRKIVYLDETREFASRHYVPPELSRMFRMGRVENIQLLTSTQFPSDFHADLRGSVTEWVCFKIDERVHLDALRDYLPNPERLTLLPAGSYIARNARSGGELAGRLF